MAHEIHRVTGFKRVGDFTLKVQFEDGTEQTIDLEPVFHGEVYGPLADPKVFAQVRLDEEVHTLVWPNGADFDPSTLYHWPEVAPRFASLAKTWGQRVG